MAGLVDRISRDEVEEEYQQGYVGSDGLVHAEEFGRSEYGVVERGWRVAEYIG